MRVDHSACGEPRDALAQEWADCLARHLPEPAWLPVPNIGTAVEEFLRHWRIDAVILSGGNDVGSCARRDETERLVCEYSIRADVPVLGICRGLHFLQLFHGGRVQDVPPGHTTARVHPVHARHRLGKVMLASDLGQVNSFHGQGVFLEGLADRLEPWLVSPDGLVEGMKHHRYRHLAVQWHPERELPDPDLARRLLRFFYLEL
jgi:putative glutamine amidotransferase